MLLASERTSAPTTRSHDPPTQNRNYYDGTSAPKVERGGEILAKYGTERVGCQHRGDLDAWVIVGTNCAPVTKRASASMLSM